MFESWKELEGDVVDEKFRLRQYLGGSDASAVFLVDEGEGTPTAAIKLIPTDDQKREPQLSRWRAAERLSHPHLIGIFQVGHCRLGDGEFCYLVMEYAEENLGQLIPQRPLTVNEAHELVRPVMDVLVYLHRNGLVHGGIKPSNILAIGDQVKLSSDGLYAAGEFAGTDRLSIYTAPEATTGGLTAAADAWSLGITLLEALTGHPPAWEGKEQVEPVFPATLPTPFLDVVRHCVRRDPLQRWTIADIYSRLRQESFLPQAVARSQSGSKRRNYALVVLGGLGVAAVLSGFGLLADRWGGEQASPVSQLAETGEGQDKPSAEADSNQLPTEDRPVNNAVRPAFPLSLPEETVSDSRGKKGVVIYREMPNVSQQALATIQGTVRVRIRVGVDSSGSIVAARFDSAGPSRYFAGRAMQAAKLWKFEPALVDGQNVASEWTLRFEYRNTGTTVIPSQTAP